MRFNIRMLLAVTLVCAVLARPAWALVGDSGFFRSAYCAAAYFSYPVQYVMHMEHLTVESRSEQPTSMCGAMLGLAVALGIDAFAVAVVVALTMVVAGVVPPEWKRGS